MFWDTLIFNHWSINLHSLIVLALSYYSFIFFSIVLYLLSTTSKTRIEQQMTLLDTLPKCCRNNFSVLWTILVEFRCKEFKCLTETITVATYKTTLKQIHPPASVPGQILLSHRNKPKYWVYITPFRFSKSINQKTHNNLTQNSFISSLPRQTLHCP